MIKTFRGQLADGGQDRIKLQTIKGKVGYRIAKFEVMATDPSESTESAIKIYLNEQTSVDAIINFTDSNLLAAGIYQSSSSGETYPIDRIIIFDNQIFNQDIYITLLGVTTARALNYYIELEVIPLDDKGAEYTTIKDLRTRGF